MACRSAWTVCSSAAEPRKDNASGRKEKQLVDLEHASREELIAHITRLYELSADLADSLARLAEVAQKTTLRLKELEQQQKGEN